ncbi:hypothetical protein DIPPA_23309 [Diplonema papillatum]|nr:hypothetical protein DIPPA_23309 [Diplonema papillatum]
MEHPRRRIVLPKSIVLPEEWREKLGVRLQEAEEQTLRLVSNSSRGHVRSLFGKVKEEILSLMKLLHHLVNDFVTTGQTTLDAVVDQHSIEVDYLQRELTVLHGDVTALERENARLRAEVASRSERAPQGAAPPGKGRAALRNVTNTAVPSDKGSAKHLPAKPQARGKASAWPSHASPPPPPPSHTDVDPVIRAYHPAVSKPGPPASRGKGYGANDKVANETSMPSQPASSTRSPGSQPKPKPPWGRGRAEKTAAGAKNGASFAQQRRDRTRSPAAPKAAKRQGGSACGMPSQKGDVCTDAWRSTRDAMAKRAEARQLAKRMKLLGQSQPESLDGEAGQPGGAPAYSPAQSERDSSSDDDEECDASAYARQTRGPEDDEPRREPPRRYSPIYQEGGPDPRRDAPHRLHQRRDAALPAHVPSYAAQQPLNPGSAPSIVYDSATDPDPEATPLPSGVDSFPGGGRASAKASYRSDATYGHGLPRDSEQDTEERYPLAGRPAGYSPASRLVSELGIEKERGTSRWQESRRYSGASTCVPEGHDSLGVSERSPTREAGPAYGQGGEWQATCGQGNASPRGHAQGGPRVSQPSVRSMTRVDTSASPLPPPPPSPPPPSPPPPPPSSSACWTSLPHQQQNYHHQQQQQHHPPSPSISSPAPQPPANLPEPYPMNPPSSSQSSSPAKPASERGQMYQNMLDRVRAMYRALDD